MAVDPHYYTSAQAARVVQALQSSLIEAKLERCYKAIDSVSHAEDTRRHRLQLLMLEDTNDELQDLLESESERFAELDGELQSAHLECEELRLGVQGHMWDVKSRERELELAQAELHSLQLASKESAQLYSEKLALAQEVTKLRLEVKHSQAQIAQHAEVLTEKLQLQRNVDALRIEAQSTEATMARLIEDHKAHTALQEEYRQRVEAVQSDAEQKARELARLRPALLEAEASLKELITSKQAATRHGNIRDSIERAELEGLRQALAIEKQTSKSLSQTLKGNINSQQTALGRDGENSSRRTHVKENKVGKDHITKQATKRTTQTRRRRLDGSEVSQIISQKREISEVDPNSYLGTPGNGLAAKRKKVSVAQAGDKSTFSITPFLNRITGIAPSSPQSIDKSHYNQPETGDNSIVKSIEADTEPERSQRTRATSPAKRSRQALGSAPRHRRLLLHS